MNWALADMAQALEGAVHLHGNGAVRIARICTDSRDVRPGDFFVALQGERFDAAAFVPQALQAGAAACLLNQDRAEVLPAGAPALLVPDAKLAFGQLAAHWRKRMTGPVIAVAGSNGKTTVTQMLAAILSVWTAGHHLATQGNFNNEIGLPITLLRWREGMQAAVLELGMNHPGEMAYLSPIAAPTVALVNNAQREHQEFMQTVEAVARENGEVLRALPAQGVAVVPHGDVHLPIWREMAGQARVLTFGESREADVHVLRCNWQGDAWALLLGTPAGELPLRLHVVGRHNVRNAMAAVACAHAADVPLADIAAGLTAFRAVNGRSRLLSIAQGERRVTLIDDTYNANPDSVEALIDMLAELPEPRLLVLGDMAEVGEDGPRFHREVGEYAARQGVAQLFTLGELSRHASEGFGHGLAGHADDVESLTQRVLAEASGFATIAVKGSRFMRMERVVQALQLASEVQRGESC